MNKKEDASQKLVLIQFLNTLTQLIRSCSKPTIEVLEKGVKYVHN